MENKKKVRLPWITQSPLKDLYKNKQIGYISGDKLLNKTKEGTEWLVITLQSLRFNQNHQRMCVINITDFPQTLESYIIKEKDEYFLGRYAGIGSIFRTGENTTAQECFTRAQNMIDFATDSKNTESQDPVAQEILQYVNDNSYGEANLPVLEVIQNTTFKNEDEQRKAYKIQSCLKVYKYHKTAQEYLDYCIDSYEELNTMRHNASSHNLEISQEK